MTTLVVATGNPGKLQEMQAYLFGTDWQLELKPTAIDVEETGETFVANACLKASQVALATGQWAIADDSGLSVDALGGAPGIYSARYAPTDATRIQRVLDELRDQPHRGAQFVCAIAVARPNGEIVICEEGICRGEILAAARGDGGFGYDPADLCRNVRRYETSPQPSWLCILPGPTPVAGAAPAAVDRLNGRWFEVT
jgi:XTP/dITP diphosphohydrolase